MSGFATTRWSLIQQARADDADGRAALDWLCRAYRQPVIAYIRHHGRHAGDSDDLAQAFFLHLLENNLPARADPLRGGFRPYLLAALRNFLHSQAVTAAAGKRSSPEPLLFPVAPCARSPTRHRDTHPSRHGDPPRTVGGLVACLRHLGALRR